MRIHIKIIKNIMIGAERFGVNPVVFREKMNLSPEQYAQEDQMVDWEKGAIVWDFAAELAANRLIGLQIGELMSEMSLGLAGHLMHTSPTLGAAFEQVGRFNGAFSEMFYYRTHISQHEFELEFAPAEPYWIQYPESARHAIETSMVASLNVAKMLTGKKAVPLRANFAYPPPVEDLSEYQRLLGHDLRFRQPKSSLIFKSATANLPVIGHNAELLRMFQELAQSFIQAQQSHSNNIAALVKKTILDHFRHQLPQVRDVAAHMNMSERSLQRKLQAAGISYHAIVEDIRSEMAVNLLKQKQFTANEVGYMLGYADAAAFRRAFKRWTGVNPGAMAKEL